MEWTLTMEMRLPLLLVSWQAGVLSGELEEEDLSPRPPLLEGKGEVDEALRRHCFR